MHLDYPLLGFLLYLRDLWLNFFQITKSLSFNSYPVSLLIFSFLLLAVYPVDVTTYWCFFLRIIIYNFATIYGIATEFGITMCPYPAFQCTKFQGNQIMLLCFMTTFTPWQKEQEKNKETLWRFNSWRNLVVECEMITLGGIPTTKNHLVSLKAMHRPMHVWKSHYYSSLMGVAHRLLGRTTHYCVSWSCSQLICNKAHACICIYFLHSTQYNWILKCIQLYMLTS